jgi:hypothetical protein
MQALDEEQVYVWIGEASAEERLEFGSAVSVVLGTLDEELFEAVSEDSWDRGERVGTVSMTYHETPSGQMANVSATFDLSDLEGFAPGDSLVGQGALRYEGGVLVGGRLSITGGTGRFRRARGQADVDHRNPHKYRVAVSTE